MEPCCEQTSRGQRSGSGMTPRLMSLVTVWLQARHRKKAVFMSGMIGVALMMRPLMVTSLSMSGRERGNRKVSSE